MTAITMLYHIRRRNRRSLKNICGENLIYSVLKIGCCLERNVNPVRHILLRQKLEELFQNFNKGKNQQSFSSDHLIKKSSVESASFFSFGDQLEMMSSKCKVFSYWDSLHARLNNHYKAWSYKKKKHKKIKA